jgi:filamentous hemagglutinin family protein
MKKSIFWLTFFTLAHILIGGNIAQAQTYTPTNRTPVADNSLSTQVSGNGNNFDITGGLRKGQTLFHSFTDFSVPTGGAANFLNPVGNRDIISRVTGGLFSDINGLVNSNGANFYLINPNGIVFGPNAQLNVGRAFVASTASGINLVDGGGRTFTFGTNPNGDAPLLTVDSSVLFNPNQLIMGAGSGGIVNFGTLQTANAGQYIGLVGGDVTINGGRVAAPGGRIDLGGLNSAGTVTVNQQGLVFSGDNLLRGDVSVLNGGGVTVAANDTLGLVTTPLSNISSPGSSINVVANNLNIVNDKSTGVTTRSFIDAGLNKDSGIKTVPGGDIKIDATGNITLNYGAIYNTIETGAAGQIGGISINANSLDLKNESWIDSRNNGGVGNSGNVDISTAGNITISGTDDPNLLDGKETQSLSKISASTLGQGNSGKVTLDVKGDLSVSNRGGIFSSVIQGANGNSQGVKITANNLTLANFSNIESGNYGGVGNAGNVDITTTGNLTIFGTNLPALLDGKDTVALSAISASTLGQGNSGKVTLDVKGDLSVSNRGGIFSNVIQGANGNSQGVKITANNLTLANFSYIQSGNYGGVGNAGNVDITTTGNLTIFGTNLPALLDGKDTVALSAISASTLGQGNSGKVTLDVGGDLLVFNRGAIFSNILLGANGNSEGIQIVKAKNIGIGNLSYIQSENNGGVGNAGNIDINTSGDLIIIGTNNPSLLKGDSLSYLSKISTSTNGSGTAGKITINAKGNLSLINRARISSKIEQNGKSITKDRDNTKIDIKAGNILVGNFSLIESENIGGEGDAGDIAVDTSGNLRIIGYNDPSQVIGQDIRARSGISSNVSNSTKGNTGKITLKVKGDLLILDRGGIFSSVSETASGNSQGINIKARNIGLRNLSYIQSGNYSNQGAAGNISITTDRLYMNARSDISSYGEGVSGGSITFNLSQMLVMADRSRISTDSYSTNKDSTGGNINITSPLIVALTGKRGNNDITANAYAEGKGGKIEIISQGLFGIQKRDLRSPQTNDITATANRYNQQGTVTIDTPGTDPGKDSTALPEATTDISNQISQVCSANSRDNSLVVTGRGGLPPNADDTLTSDVIWQDGRGGKSPTTLSQGKNPVNSLPPPAVGWVFDGKGKVRLIAASAAQQPTRMPIVCPNK